MKKKKTSKPDVYPAGTEFVSDYPFYLRNHSLWHDENSDLPPIHWEKVSSLGKQAIYRLPELPDKPNEAISPSFKDWLDSGKNTPDEKAVMDTKDPVVLARIVESALGRLAARVRKGDGKATWLFGSIANQIGQALSDMTFHNPKVWKPIAKQHSRWPMMRSTHPKNCDPDSWLDDMELGSAHPLTLDKYSKWKPGFAATYAFELYSHLQFLREENPTLVFKNGEKGMREILPEFNRDTVEQWWEMAWQYFLFSYPKPENIPEFDRLVTAKSKRKYPSTRRQEIKDILKARFVALSKE